MFYCAALIGRARDNSKEREASYDEGLEVPSRNAAQQNFQHLAWVTFSAAALACLFSILGAGQTDLTINYLPQAKQHQDVIW